MLKCRHKIIKVIFVKIWKADKAILKMVEGREGELVRK